MKRKIRVLTKEAKIAKELLKYRYKCLCGHTVYLVDNPYKICTHCGRPIFKNKRYEFIYKVGGIKCLH